MGTESPAPVAMRRLQPLLGAACAACGAVHLAVAPGEGSAWIVAGITLAAIGALQLLLAGALLSGARFARGAVAWVSVGVAALWAMSTSTGVPVGPHPWMPEAVTLPGIAVTVVELALAFALFWLPSPRPASVPLSWAPPPPPLPPPPPPPPAPPLPEQGQPWRVPGGVGAPPMRPA